MLKSEYSKNISKRLRKDYPLLSPYFDDMAGYYNIPYKVYSRSESIRENVKCLMLDDNFSENSKECWFMSMFIKEDENLNSYPVISLILGDRSTFL